MNSDLWADLNTLAAYLREFNVVELVRVEYAQHGNPAPPHLLEEQIKKLDELLASSTGEAK